MIGDKGKSGAHILPKHERSNYAKALRAHGHGYYGGSENPTKPGRIPIHKRGTPAKVQRSNYSGGTIFLHDSGPAVKFNRPSKRARKSQTAKFRGIGFI